MEIRAIIPAAGKGTRLGSTDQIPKVMRLCAGAPLLETVLKSVDFIRPENIYIVVGYKKEKVMDYFGDKYNYAEQTKQLGTGHAVMTCADAFKRFDGPVVVTFGDMPLFRKEDIMAMCDRHVRCGADCTLMTAQNPELTLWARVIRDKDGKFASIVEGKDCTEEQAKIKELFAGVFVFNSRSLFKILPEVKTDNVQQEYYLTEVPELMVLEGMKVETYKIKDGDDLRGVNTKTDLALCEKILLRRRSNMSLIMK